MLHTKAQFGLSEGKLGTSPKQCTARSNTSAEPRKIVGKPQGTVRGAQNFVKGGGGHGEKKEGARLIGRGRISVSRDAEECAW